MDAWKTDLGADGIRFLADPDASFVKKFGLSIDIVCSTLSHCDSQVLNLFVSGSWVNVAYTGGAIQSSGGEWSREVRKYWSFTGRVRDMRGMKHQKKDRNVVVLFRVSLTGQRRFKSTGADTILQEIK